MAISWNRSAAQHLARRAGFGGTPAEIDALTAMGLDAAVRSFVDTGAVDMAPFETALAAFTVPVPPLPAAYDLNTLTGIQKWFLHRMAFSPRPLEEKMTLFWNQILTSAISKVNDTTLLLNQNKTQRRLALGRLDELILEITKDPAMLIWLDNNANTKNRPNENYARELMELFTIGVDRYTQADVTEVARSLTGWTITRPSGGSASQYTFFFDAANHDNGSKTILGRTGVWNADEAIRILLEATDSAGVALAGKFLAYNLWSSFAYHDPPEWVLTELAAVYVSSSHSIRAVVDHLFRMEEFYEPHARKALIRSPIEYIVAGMRQLEARTDMSSPASNLVPMGQTLFNPLDAKGWEGDFDWINTGTLFARASFSNSMATNRGATGTRLDVAALVAGKPMATARDVVNAVADRLGLADASPDCLAVWEKYVDSKSDGSRGYWTNTAAARDVKVRGLIHLMLTSADYHLC